MMRVVFGSLADLTRRAVLIPFFLLSLLFSNAMVADLRGQAMTVTGPVAAATLGRVGA